MNRILNDYYGANNQISDLLVNHRDKIVFLNGLVDAQDLQQDGYYFGAISVNSNNTKRSLRNIFSNFSTTSNPLQFDDKI